MENGTHSIWVSEQIKELGHEVIVGNVVNPIRLTYCFANSFRTTAAPFMTKSTC